ncbi:MAG: glycoside hydrolase family 30 protein [Chitinophagaceae bacterium]|nr:glycoside hydrolase family 30 protein [Chitinophagaceae bacterium]MBK8785946.1 glycoside hydrolase family 30 protein [Chitinophagaceae bacterium]MBL0199827.1 glycoside hydrolase family 30 protein [Chitinophagaceae bacterium]
MNIKQTGYSLLCVLLAACAGEKKADSPAAAFSTDGKKVIVYTTADSSNLRLSATDTLEFTEKKQPFENEITIFVDPGKTFQTYFGIGAALTDASAETFYKLPKDKQQEFMTAYFSADKGIGYTVGRTNINSCDFSSDMYTYIKDGDKELTSFNIEHDRKYKIPFIKEAMTAAGGKLNLFASPWSPPAWMKDNNDMLHGGKLKSEFHDSWAMYYTKFIKEYEKAGVPVWGISIQNEPMATQKWESCLYTGEEERDFLKEHLGPTMVKEGLKDKKIIVWDHNRDMIYQRAQTYFDDPEAAKYIWGIGFHWYEDWSGGTPMYDNLRRVHEAYPDKNIFFTEGCAESFDSTRYNAWVLGEEYGRSMINDFNNGMVGFTDWNILLDEKGGPNHVQNFCFAPVHGDTRTGQLIYTNAYYYIGHFSKFIKAGAKRIISSSSRSQLLTTAFKNEDGKVVVIVMNQGNIKTPYNLWINGKAAACTALPHSISTLIL